MNIVKNPTKTSDHLDFLDLSSILMHFGDCSSLLCFIFNTIRINEARQQKWTHLGIV